MKAVIAALCVVALVGTYMFAMESATPSVEAQFEDFVATYRKSYLSEDSHSYRLGVFKQNLDEIARLNQANPSATYAVNHFADMTEEERVESLGLKPLTQVREGKTFSATGNRHQDSIDWQSAGESTKVKDQKSCGSCWAFSGTETLESAYAIANHGKVDEFPILSEQIFVDCAVAPEFGSAGCQGGWMDDCFAYAQKYQVATEQNYPYTAKNGKCNTDLATVDLGVTGTLNVKAGDLEGLLELVEIHPVAIAVDAGDWSFYKSGVHKSTGTSLNHGVVADGFELVGTEQYIKVKNSWGTRWGMKGYILLDTVQNSGATLSASAPQMRGITYPSAEEPNAKCSDGSDANEDDNCLCSYGKGCSSTTPCKPACGCGEFGFCR